MWVNKKMNDMDKTITASIHQQTTKQQLLIIRLMALWYVSFIATVAYAAGTPLTANPTILEARFEIVSDTPTIYRGGTGQQLITVTNKGPNGATGTTATVIPTPQSGVTVTSVTVVGGSACTSVSGQWSCSVNSIANNGSFQLRVNYSTTAATATGTAKQVSIKVDSNEFNPGSGAGETLYKVWGSNKADETQPNGAFWVGFTGSGGTTTTGAYRDEGTSLQGAWPVTASGPTGAYLVTDQAGPGNSIYGASTTNASPMLQRIVKNMSTDPEKTVNLPNLSGGYDSGVGDNRRAWEYITGVYIPTTSESLTFCVGKTSIGVDDGAYIVVDGTVSAETPKWAKTGLVSTSVTLTPGFHRVSYRIVNRNTVEANNHEFSAGGYGAIGIGTTSDNCNTATFDTYTSNKAPASINIVDGAALSISKTNNANLVSATRQTTYTLTVENQGPSTVTGAILQDPVAANMSKGTPVCSTVANNQCTTATTPTAAQLEVGFALPTLASGQKYVLNVPVTLSATSVTSVTNAASIKTPADATALSSACVDDTTNNFKRTFDSATGTCSTSDTDNIAAEISLQKITNGGVGTFNFSLTNTTDTTASVTTTTAGTATPVDSDTNTAGEQDFMVSALNTNITLKENTLPTGWKLSSISCKTGTSEAGNFDAATGIYTIAAAKVVAGASFACTAANNKLPTLTLSTVSQKSIGSFIFKADGSNSNGWTDQTITTTAADTAAVGATQTLSNINTATGIAETLPSNFQLASVSCSGMGTGGVVTVDTVNGKFSLNAAATAAGSNIACTVTNRLKPATLQLVKAWGTNSSSTDSATIPATTGGANNTTAFTVAGGTAGNSGSPIFVNVGDTITFGAETGTNIGNYASILDCKANGAATANSLSGTNAQAANTLVVGAADAGKNLVCTYTNTIKTYGVKLTKAWTNGKTNDSVSLSITGANAATAGSSTVGGTTTIATATGITGSKITFAESFTTGSSSNYTSSLTCKKDSDNSAVTVNNNQITMPNDSAVTCTFTNSRIAQQLNLAKQWQNALNGHTANITTTGGTNNATLSSTATGSNLTNGTAVTVYAGDVVTLPIETFGGGASAAQYNSSLSCTGGTPLASGVVNRTITISNSTTATVCTYINTRQTVTISGKVFEDNSGSTGNAANAYNGSVDAGEQGIAGSTVKLTDNAGTVIATTQTDTTGNYSFNVLASNLPATFKITQSNIAGYTSVSGTTGYNLAADTITLNNTGAATYSNNNFGDARLNLILVPSNQQTTTAGGVVDYAHQISSNAVINLTAITQTATQSPANAADQNWQALIYVDNNCNGKVDSGENVLNANQTLLPNQKLCIVDRVSAPINASGGSQSVITIQAKGTATNSNIAVTSNTVTDTTLIGTAGLDMKKGVRVVASCPSTASDTNAFVTANQAKNGDMLEYEITYRNNSVKNLIDISVKDSVPTGMVFKSQTCVSTPSGMNCTPTQSGTSLVWSMTGKLPPNGTGSVRYCVAVP